MNTQPTKPPAQSPEPPAPAKPVESEADLRKEATALTKQIKEQDAVIEKANALRKPLVERRRSVMQKITTIEVNKLESSSS